MNLFCIIFGIVVIIVSILYALNKIMPTNNKEEHRVNVAILILLAGLIIVLKGAISNYSNKAFTITMILWLVACVINLIIINRKNKEKGGKEHGKNK